MFFVPIARARATMEALSSRGWSLDQKQSSTTGLKRTLLTILGYRETRRASRLGLPGLPRSAHALASTMLMESVKLQSMKFPAFQTGAIGRRPVRCAASSTKVADASPSRRAILRGAGLAIALPSILPSETLAAGGTGANVGSYLPAAGDGFVQFKPSDTQTPAIRAGVIKAKNSYGFKLPSSWSEQKIANIQSGNFCMPRCDEPWQEVVFADPAEGSATLYVMNKRRLTNKAEATIDKIGAPGGLLQSLGPYITGTYLDEDDLLAADKVNKDGRAYYKYVANSISGKGGPHYIALATTKDDLLYLFSLSASDSQWKKAQSKLEKVVDSFKV